MPQNCQFDVIRTITTSIFSGTERIINTKSTTVVDDIIDELCNVIGVETVSKINYRESLNNTDFGEIRNTLLSETVYIKDNFSTT